MMPRHIAASTDKKRLRILLSGLGSGERSFEVACIYPFSTYKEKEREVTAVWAWTGGVGKRKTTDPELAPAEHRWERAGHVDRIR